LIAAIGRAHFVKAGHVREGAVVIDVGINRIDDKTNERGYRLVGDVAFDEVAPKAKAITPVPRRWADDHCNVDVEHGQSRAADVVEALVPSACLIIRCLIQAPPTTAW